MVFVLMGPPTYAGRKPLRTGEDANDNAGMSMFGSQDEQEREKQYEGAGERPYLSASSRTQSTSTAAPIESSTRSNNTMEIWHYRRELLPKAIPYQQVDFEFVTRKDYGINVCSGTPSPYIRSKPRNDRETSPGVAAAIGGAQHETRVLPSASCYSLRFSCPIAAGAFRQAEGADQGGSWADALKTLRRAGHESGKPGNEAARKQLEAPSLSTAASATRTSARTTRPWRDFSAYLKLQPNAEIDKDRVYSKKAGRGVREGPEAGDGSRARRSPRRTRSSSRRRSRGSAIRRPSVGRRPRALDHDGREKAMWKTLPDGNARIAFVETFWGARDPAFRKRVRTAGGVRGREPGPGRGADSGVLPTAAWSSS
jgi:hypothetical protein